MSGKVKLHTVSVTGTATLVWPVALTVMVPVYVPPTAALGMATSTHTGALVFAGTAKGAAAAFPLYGSTNGTSGSGTLPSWVGDWAGAGCEPAMALLPVKSIILSR